MALGRFHEVVLDCAEPRRLADFWRALVGGEIDARTQTPVWCAIDGCAGIGRIGFQRVPEGKVVKNRVHIDVDVTDLADATRRAVALGATAEGGVWHEPPGAFQVMRDPEGNEFCFVTDYPVVAPH